MGVLGERTLTCRMLALETKQSGDDLYCSPNIVRVIKSRRMRWAGHVARMGEERRMYRVLVGETGGKETTGET